MADDHSKFETEMNRGFLQILVLVVLQTPMYGYRMIKYLEQHGYTVEESTLYPLLRRLEKYQLITSTWSVGDDRPKKFYRITPHGKGVKEKLLHIWNHQNTILQILQQGE